ncbi:hypothetical protein C8R45DRAFT_170830 [Mycena sanguinolenta]|nr:hypothetical protein C8R45DRAFT_170830 [Mycena sanguinolenta]
MGSSSSPTQPTSPVPTIIHEVGRGFPLRTFILACLVTALLVIATMLVCASRRGMISRPSRSWVGETRPKLWDVWIQGPSRGPTQTAEWCDIQPLAATVWDHNPFPPSANNTSPKDHSHGTFSNTKFFCEDSEELRVQVAVLITMPHPPSPFLDGIRDSSARPGARLDDGDNQEYCFGLCGSEMPWRRL